MLVRLTPRATPRARNPPLSPPALVPAITSTRAVAYRSLTELNEIPASGTLDGADVLPSFECLLADLLP